MERGRHFASGGRIYSGGHRDDTAGIFRAGCQRNHLFYSRNFYFGRFSYGSSGDHHRSIGSSGYPDGSNPLDAVSR